MISVIFFLFFFVTFFFFFLEKKTHNILTAFQLLFGFSVMSVCFRVQFVSVCNLCGYVILVHNSYGVNEWNDVA